MNHNEITCTNANGSAEFKAAVKNAEMHAVIRGGTFRGDVDNRRGYIEGGEFYGIVDNGGDGTGATGGGSIYGGTFHSFAFSVLRQYRPAWAEGPVTVMDSADSASAIQQCKERLKVGKGDRSFPKTQTIIGLLSKARNKEISIGDVLQRECSYDVVQSVHEQLRGRIQEHKESHDPEPLELSVREVGEVLSNSGVPSEKAEAFEAECRRQYGENAALNPKNLIEAGKFQITTPEVKITVSPEYSYMVEARVIDGRKYILIPADENVEVNGITVNIPNPQTAEEI